MLARPPRGASTYGIRESASAETRKHGDLEVTVAVLSAGESRRFFAVRMARRGMQPVWVRVVNRSKDAYRLDLLGIG